MKVRDVAVGDLEPADVERWTRLAEGAIEPNAFLDPRYLAVSARLDPFAARQRVLIAEDGGDMIGMMPYSVAAVTLGRRRLRALSLRCDGAYLQDASSRFHPLLASDRADRAAELLIEGALRHGGGEVLDLRRVPEGHLIDALTDAARRRRLPVYRMDREHIHCVDARPGDVGEPTDVVAVSHLGATTRKTRRKEMRTLQQALGAELAFEDRGDDPEALEQFLELQAAGWKGQTESGGKAYLPTGRGDWIRAVASAFREDGRFVVFVLRAGQRIVHMQIAFRSGNAVFGLADAYDEELGHFGVGALGRLASVQWALFATDADYYDPTMDIVSGKVAPIFPHTLPVVTYAVGLRGGGRQLVRALPALRRAREWAAAVPRGRGAVQR
ncbi:GNAT family N-acetyltransferase [Microbacterium rhizophilus]|uniref:GNAT family N-acetyltransferase n=1 Tax=Microbacterium rhizophilus TaxID=3138934 RepID=UPI0031E90F4D